MNAHFFKTLTGFILIIGLGLGILFALDYFEKNNGVEKSPASSGAELK